MVVWLRDARARGRAHKVIEPFTPSFFVRASSDRLARLEEKASLLPGVGRVVREERFCALDEHPSRVLRVDMTRHGQLYDVARVIDELGEFYEHDLFDVDLRMSHRWFLAMGGLFPFARVRCWKPGSYELRDDQWDIDFQTPELRISLLDAFDRDGKTPLTLDAPLGSVTLDDATLVGSEEAILTGLCEEVRRRDPDIVLTRGGDSLLFPYLEERRKHAGLPKLALGRDGSAPRVMRKSRSFFTYGKVKYQPGPVAIPGRIHIDLDASTFCAEGGLEAMVEQSRITSTTMQELSRLTTGTAFSTMQVDVAKRDGDRLIPYRKNYPEAPKNGHTYLLADRGAFAFDPQVGVYEDCHELDFASFFPNLMVKRNLSPETVLCDCCDPSDPTHPPQLFVPQVGYHVCRRRSGINGETLARLIERRRVYKARRKSMPGELDKWQARSDILKMELVCSFGYQGHKNHRLGRIEVHESINAWARHDLLKTAAIAREHGFDILHGLSDSLWLKRFAKSADPEELSRHVEREIGVPFEVQGRYKWLVLLPNKTSNAPHAAPVGALTRFYGCYDGDVLPTRSSGHQKLDYIRGGRVKVRGIELRQHSTCTIIRRIQEAVLERLADADDLAGLHAMLPRALEDAGMVLARIRDGAVPLHELVITNSIMREEEDFRVRTHAWAAVSQLKRAGVRVPPGESVRYVVTNDADRSDERVREARLVRGDEEYDRAFYERLALRALASLLIPFGFAEERLEVHFSRTRQQALSVSFVR